MDCQNFEEMFMPLITKLEDYFAKPICEITSNELWQKHWNIYETEGFSVDSGCYKGVIIPSFGEYVLKWDLGNKDNILQKEQEFYSCYIEDTPYENFILPPRFVFMYDNMDFYVQKKVTIGDNGDYIRETPIELSESLNSYTNDCDEDLLADFSDYYGEEDTTDFFNMLINDYYLTDFHNGNYGFINTYQPVLIDYILE